MMVRTRLSSPIFHFIFINGGDDNTASIDLRSLCITASWWRRRHRRSNRRSREAAAPQCAATTPRYRCGRRMMKLLIN
ncbi:Os06g0515400 [Oryza sativa Japonica Group]|uniref:Os06g0515400 protein n=2 Tax=Oryza sativa subsp. japonica TaxID=39947 RepID=A0A0P0WX76_ORYSJ|nr:unknown protein [Oryza sativa Japonica Group]BAH93548.1 Os06g0515400 [Oryza sativa Japonica Group]BAS97984.1 Os06g0515400 [Oryza sativa Japonica Group]|eukprot:NP_001174820.1 Os06g0515400 [Oryza sativa Japonica Group]